VAATAPEDPAAGRKAALVSQTITDDSGHYRLDNIPPGRYYIQAGPIDFPTFYPGVTAPPNATSLLIGAGAVIEGIDFTLGLSAGVRVRGHVPSGWERPDVIRMSSRSAGSSPSSITPVEMDGTFEFLTVRPGRYELSARGLRSSFEIIVTDKDIDVDPPRGSGVTVKGIVGLGGRSPHPSGQTVALKGTSAWAYFEAAVDKAGEFEIGGVLPGTYTVTVLPLPASLTYASSGSAALPPTIIVGNRDVTAVRIPAYAELRGQISFQDGRDLPWPETVTIEAKPLKGVPLVIAVRYDGAFRFPLTEGEYHISLGRLPVGATVKSMFYGDVDLSTESLKLDGTSDLQEFRITLASKP
jgi:hypothetical protein